MDAPQEAINEQEWQNPQNWSDDIVQFYFSKRDSRIWVPKRGQLPGWTFNLAHPAGAWLMVGVIVLAVAVAALVGLLPVVLGQA
jgi:uncharacterized membrane protein